jgi:hypothetical protein
VSAGALPTWSDDFGDRAPRPARPRRRVSFNATIRATDANGCSGEALAVGVAATLTAPASLSSAWCRQRAGDIEYHGEQRERFRDHLCSSRLR